jgi:hypothetical protein
VFLRVDHFPDIRAAELGQVGGHWIERVGQFAELVVASHLDAFVEVSPPKALAPRRQRADRADNGARQVPGDDHGDASAARVMTSTTPRAPAASSRAPATGALGQLEMTIADGGRQRHPRRSTGWLCGGIGPGVAFRSHGHDVIRGLTIRAKLGAERSREVAFVIGPSTPKRSSNRAIDDRALANQRLRAALVAGHNQQDRIVLAFQGGRPVVRSRP